MGRKSRILIADFETVVTGEDDQDETAVWAAAIVEIYTEDVRIFHSISELYDYMEGLRENLTVYFHNLAFDGSFWVDWLITQKELKQAYYTVKDEDSGMTDYIWHKDKMMESNSFKYSISDRGQWYTITIKTKCGKFIEIRDSLKLMPASVKRLGKDFQTKHRKSEIEYEGFRYPGCEITEEEQDYIANDVLVVKEALELMYAEGHDKLTIGSCCMAEFKSIYREMDPHGSNNWFNTCFPDLYKVELDKTVHGVENADAFIRRAYRGGWCYVVPGKSKRVVKNGCTADVNSLYPSVMHSDSGNVYPYGPPHFWRGDFIPETAIGEDRYFYIRIKTRFYLREGKLPFVQIKHTKLYKNTEMLTSSDYVDPKTGETKRTLDDGYEMIPELTMTETDFYLLQDHYKLEDTVILGGCWFEARAGLFDDYINKYMALKQESTGARRSIFKLLLNNLYGKFGASKVSSYKVAYVKDNGVIGFLNQWAEEKQPGYIAVGAAVTSYARFFTITAAQQNYYGPDKPGFIYADTDSLHQDLRPDELKGVPIHPTALLHWKIESQWDEGYFTRQKTYIEHLIIKDGEPLEKPRYNTICAGMPARTKGLFELSMTGSADPKGYKDPDTGVFKSWTDAEYKFLFDEDGKPIIRGYDKFDIGLSIPGKLAAKRVRGGIVLKRTTYEMH